ncbi:DUF1015 domain-containing protein [bacterium]|nr:DUF1015 domain-containing protein [bacterium]
MAEIIPFRGIRYNPAKVCSDQVVTKPYDKISPAEQDAYYAKNPYNIVRIILGKIHESDTETDNRYTRAADFFKKWQDDHILIREPQPVFYVYDQIFQHKGYPQMKRRALIGLGKLYEYADAVIYPHEKTLTGPKKDRLALLKATEAQFGQLFMLYDDPDAVVNRSLDTVSVQEPLYRVTDPDGVVHTIYPVEDGSIIKMIQTMMANKKLLIADGHHRYETALNYRNEMRKRYGSSESAPYDYHLMSFVNIHDPGLLILPTHRMVKNLSETLLRGWLDKAGKWFDINKTSLEKIEEATKNNSAEPVQIGVYDNAGAAYLLTVKNAGALRAQMETGKPSAWYRLPVTILHDLILDKVLGIDQEKLAMESNVTYVRSVDEGVELVRAKTHQLGFFVPATPIDKVMEISFAQITMPQKSTDFYPKVFTGFAINSLK